MREGGTAASRLSHSATCETGSATQGLRPLRVRQDLLGSARKGQPEQPSAAIGVVLQGLRQVRAGRREDGGQLGERDEDSLPGPFREREEAVRGPTGHEALETGLEFRDQGRDPAGA